VAFAALGQSGVPYLQADDAHLPSHRYRGLDPSMGNSSPGEGRGSCLPRSPGVAGGCRPWGVPGQGQGGGRQQLQRLHQPGAGGGRRLGAAAGLAAEPWPLPTPLAVRAAVHAGRFRSARPTSTGRWSTGALGCAPSATASNSTRSTPSHPGHLEAGQPHAQLHQPRGGRGEPAGLDLAPPWPSGTRTQVVTESLCTSRPAQRSTSVSTLLARGTKRASTSTGWPAHFHPSRVAGHGHGRLISNPGLSVMRTSVSTRSPASVSGEVIRS
jgi:hypothetical protein